MNVLVMQMTLRSRGMELPVFAGSVWHGGLGCQLNRVAPTAFASLYQVSDEARLYSFIPPEGGHWPPGQDRVLQLSLFGPACDHAMAVVQAVAELGDVGLRPGGKFVVEAVHTLTPDGQPLQTIFTSARGLLTLPVACDFTPAWASVHQQTLSQPADVLLQWRSPVRIKEQNIQLHQAPSCLQLLRRTLGRVEQLAFACNTNLNWVREGRSQWLSEAAAIASRSHDEPMHWMDLERRSARSSQSMYFGGLVGEVSYAQVTPAVRAWLHMIQGLQVGGKTAFGFGGVQVSLQTRPQPTQAPPPAHKLIPACRRSHAHTRMQEPHDTQTEKLEVGV